MIRLDAANPVEFCDGVKRRDVLHAGALGLLGLTLGDLFAAKASGQVRRDVGTNCIMLNLVGAPGQHDTWDMKPDAPAEIRGPYKPIPTNVSGIQISEILPRTAKHADKFALVRSVFSTVAPAHSVAYYPLGTGRLLQTGLTSPHLGSIVACVKGSKSDLPPHVLLPRSLGASQSAGFLSKVHEPFVLNADPSEPTFKIRDLVPPDYIGAVRAEGRRTLRARVDDAVKLFESSPDAQLMDASFERAYTLMSSASARAAFDLSQEPDGVKDRYGRHRFGTSCLLARRLIEAGVRFVTINMFDSNGAGVTWDVHGPPFATLEAYGKVLGPMFDSAYASLLEDLADRGLLESTMVVAVGEFGRSPKINPAGGRDHWPQCWSVCLAGGGIKGGQVIGSSDNIGAYPRERPVQVAQIAATVLHGLGVDVSQDLTGPQGRPIRVVDHGVEVIDELF
jgi:hypothetical protein